jgi:hypothetical protein
MRIALLTATALVALSSLAMAQDTAATATKEQPINPHAGVDPAVPRERINAPGGRLHYDLPCRVSSVGTCITEPPLYPRYKPRP